MKAVRQHIPPRHASPGAISHRRIGPFGVAARILVGVGLLASVAYGHVAGTFRPAPWILGLVGFPLLLLMSQQWRARRSPARLEATGPVAQALNIAAFLALYLTFSVTSDAALLFYGSSMLVAAVRGYGGCEVLAVSNWVLRRDDQVGCLLFGPVDYLEGRARRVGTSRPGPWPC